MNPSFINAAILPFLAIVFIADAIRDRKSGKYLGYFNRNVYMLAFMVVCLETYLFINKFGLSFITIGRIASVSALPFIGAYFFVKFTHKENYGTEFNPKTKKES